VSGDIDEIKARLAASAAISTDLIIMVIFLGVDLSCKIFAKHHAKPSSLSAWYDPCESFQSDKATMFLFFQRPPSHQLCR
jgi:hypothetical protein